MKTVYVASRFGQKDKVEKLLLELKKLDYEAPHDWTSHKPIKPLLKNHENAREYASNDIYGAKEADVFILLTDEAGTGMHSELGAAISHYLDFGKPIIYIVGEHLNTNHFFFHPAVKRIGTTEQLIKELQEENGLQT